jgi:hypothetical protein
MIISGARPVIVRGKRLETGRILLTITESGRSVVMSGARRVIVRAASGDREGDTARNGPDSPHDHGNRAIGGFAAAMSRRHHEVRT